MTCFLSLHTNAAGVGNSGRARGAEVFYSNVRPNDRDMASRLSSAVATLVGNPNRGAKLAPVGVTSPDGFGVFNGATSVNTPHVMLLESVFHDNIDDCNWIINDVNLQRLADCIVNTICEIFGWGKITPVSQLINNSEDDEVTQEQFNAMLNTWLEEQNSKSQSEWFRKEFAGREKEIEKITSGTRMRGLSIREETLAMILRALDKK
jgi:hypothetical protein